MYDATDDMSAGMSVLTTMYFCITSARAETHRMAARNRCDLAVWADVAAGNCWCVRLLIL